MTLILNALTIIVFPFLMPGIINRVKSLVAGRKGPPILQPFHDFVKLLRKGQVISHAAAFVFRMGPSVALAAMIVTALFVPMATGRSVVSFDADFVLFAYLMGIARFISIAASMETGSSFEGMGSAREGTFAILVEPAFFLILGSLCLVSGNASLESLYLFADRADPVTVLILLFCGITFFLMILTEGCRVPVDDPNTHLELTMIHEVMVLDNSGPDLAFINYAGGIKMVLLSSLAANLVTLFIGDPVLRAAVFFLVLAAVAVAVGIIESVMARIRMTNVPQFILVTLSLPLIALFTAVFFSGGGAR
jgi:formate hydrogenlyase subunit 4